MKSANDNIDGTVGIDFLFRIVFWVFVFMFFFYGEPDIHYSIIRILFEIGS